MLPYPIKNNINAESSEAYKTIPKEKIPHIARLDAYKSNRLECYLHRMYPKR